MKISNSVHFETFIFQRLFFIGGNLEGVFMYNFTDQSVTKWKDFPDPPIKPRMAPKMFIKNDVMYAIFKDQKKIFKHLDDNADEWNFEWTEELGWQTSNVVAIVPF